MSIVRLFLCTPSRDGAAHADRLHLSTWLWDDGRAWHAHRVARSPSPHFLLAALHAISQQHPWFLGLRFVLLMAAWDGERLPVSFRLIWPKHPGGYRSENALLRAMGEVFVPPRWAKLVIVGGEAA